MSNSVKCIKLHQMLFIELKRFLKAFNCYLPLADCNKMVTHDIKDFKFHLCFVEFFVKTRKILSQ